MIKLQNRTAPAPPVAPENLTTQSELVAFSRPVSKPSTPADLTTMSVSWIDGQFVAMAVHQGEVMGRWICPEANKPIMELTSLLREAATRIGYKGTTVQMALAHPRLNQLWLEIPYGGGAAVQRFLMRQVQESKSFDGAASFSSQRTIAAKLAPGLLLHLVSQELIEQLEKMAEAAGLILTTVLPVAALAQRQLPHLTLPDNELGVLAVEVGDQTLLVVGRSNGDICLARTVNENWARNSVRFAAEVSRTIQFVGQHFACNPGSVWLFGYVAPERLTELKSEFVVPVHQCPVPPPEDWWVSELLGCSIKHPANLISRDRLVEPTRRRMLSVTLAFVAVLVLVATGLTVRLHFLRLAEQRNLTLARQNNGKLTQRFQELTSENTKLTNYQAFTKEALDGRPPPVPAWFFGHLSEAIGNELVVTNFAVRAAGDHWLVSLSGHLPLVRGVADTNRLNTALGALTNQLATGPFHVRFPNNTVTTNAPSSIGSLNAISRFWNQRGASRTAGSAANGNFYLEGRFP
jgi:hypothetical protein